MELAGMRILVTGGTGALGSRIAEKLRAAGAQTVIAGSVSSDRLSAALDHSEAFASDLSVTRNGTALVGVISDQGPLDGIVFAHGVVAVGGLDEVTSDVIGRLMTVNATSVVEMTATALPALRESAAANRSPFVVTISGVISENAVAGMSAYGASKAAVRHFVAAAQRELRREGIRIFDVRPPHTETGLATRAIAGVAPQFPAGADPDEVATRIVRAIIDDEKDVPSTEF